MRRSIEILLGGAATGRELERLLREAAAERGEPFKEGARDAFRRLLVDAAMGRIYLFRYRGEAVGYATLFFRHSIKLEGRLAVVEDFHLVPMRRGQGLAQRFVGLMDEALADFGLAWVQFCMPEQGQLEAVLELSGFRQVRTQTWQKSLADDDLGPLENA